MLSEKMELSKKRIYEIVEVSSKNDKASHSYDSMIHVAVVVGLLPLTMKNEDVFTRGIDLLSAIIFLVDYLLRLCTSDYKMGVKSYKAYIAYVLTPMAIIDMLSIIPLLTIFFHESKLIGMFRIFRVFRVLKLVRYSKTMVIVSNVFRRVKRQLGAVLFLTFMYITSSAMMIFQMEPELFRNFFDALYWATISITTIGYGDIAPSTVGGRIITMISALVGVVVIALPSGIITAAYMEELKKSKH